MAFISLPFYIIEIKRIIFNNKNILGHGVCMVNIISETGEQIGIHVTSLRAHIN